MVGRFGDRLAFSVGFVRAARSYWLSVFPQIRSEIGVLNDKASTIPDSALRKLALSVHRTKRGNIDGSAAFAAFTPPTYRSAVIRAQVSFQAIYDYVDTLAEQSVNVPTQNSNQLHQALLIALEPKKAHCDYYAHNAGHRDDDSYLQEMVESCQTALDALPALPAVAEALRRLTTRIVGFQTHNSARDPVSNPTLKSWAMAETSSHSGLHWWETAASAGSSLGVFALISMAARQEISPCEVVAVEMAYFPWIGSLHSLLDSLVDLSEDSETGQQSLIRHYASLDEMVNRLRLIALESIRRCEHLPDAVNHVLVLTGMIGFYLSAKEAQLPYARQARMRILDTLGLSVHPAMAMLNVRRVIGSLELPVIFSRRV